ncbi:TPA: hypothetical protein I8627_002873 [Citrobacter freundii]|nr:hypothetical protein [Citrobacter freundii]
MTTNNHPAHGPVSLNRLHQISEILSKAEGRNLDEFDGFIHLENAYSAAILKGGAK